MQDAKQRLSSMEALQEFEVQYLYTKERNHITHPETERKGHDVFEDKNFDSNAIFILSSYLFRPPTNRDVQENEGKGVN